MELLDDTGDHTDRKGEQEDLGPEHGHLLVDILLGHHIDSLHDGDRQGQTDGHRDIEEVEYRRHGELESRQSQYSEHRSSQSLQGSSGAGTRVESGRIQI